MKQAALLVICCSYFFLANAQVSSDTSSKKWIDHFKQFRSAIYENDKAKVKAFFRFPITLSSPDIWNLVLGSEAEKENTKHRSSFTENDFNKFYTKLFPQHFIKALLKIKTEDLYKKGRFETQMLKDGDLGFKIFANYSLAESLLELNLYSEVKVDDETGKAETSIIYYFTVTKEGRLVFKQVMLAG